MVATADVTDVQRKQWMAACVDTLWHDQKGYAAIEFGFGGHLGPSGRYEFTTYRAHRYAWPAQRLEMLRDAWARAEDADVYVCPMLRARPDRKVGGGIGGRYLWADLDEWTDELEEQVLAMLRPGSFLIRSGRGRHLYLALDEFLPCERIAEMNHRLAVTLGGDAKWQENSVLRLPGTKYHKPRTQGLESTVVTWEAP